MGKNRPVSRPDRDQDLRRELGRTAQALRSAYDKFNYVSEPEMVESCIYEINSLQARYSYLLRCIKGTAPAVPAQQPASAEESSPCAAASAMEGGKLCHS